MKRFVLSRMIIVTFALIGLGALSAIAPFTHAHADASVQNVQFTSSVDGRSAQISFTGTANTDYSVRLLSIESPPAPIPVTTGDNGDGTGNASVNVLALQPGGTYNFSIDPIGAPSTDKYTFKTNRQAIEDVKQVNVTTTDNGQSAQVSFRAAANTDYRVSTTSDVENVTTDDAGKVTATLQNLVPGTTNEFEISQDVDGQTQVKGPYNFTTYPASGSVQNMIVTFSTLVHNRVANVSFTGAANTNYKIFITLGPTPISYTATTGDNGDGAGNVTTLLGSIILGGPSYTFVIQLDGQPVSDPYTFTFNE